MAKPTENKNLYACPEFGITVEATDLEGVKEVLNNNL